MRTKDEIEQKILEVNISIEETKLKISNSVKLYGNSLSHKGKRYSESVRLSVSKGLKKYYSTNASSTKGVKRTISNSDDYKKKYV